METLNEIIVRWQDESLDKDELGDKLTEEGKFYEAFVANIESGLQHKLATELEPLLGEDNDNTLDE